MVSPVDSPALLLGVDDLVDWLELTALFNPFGVARIDALLGAMLELQENAEADIGHRDRLREQMIERIDNEIDLRCRTGGDAYPFSLSENAEELHLSDDWRSDRFSFYLICLVATHVTGSSILSRPPKGQLLGALRNDVFQIVATLGLAGLSAGPAFSVGWPRRNGETIVELLTRASAAGGGFTARNPPGAYVSPKEKDGGVDVIAWTAEAIAPPTAFYFGQTASGKDWPGKPVADHARTFKEAYMLDLAAGNKNYVTLIPYRVLDDRYWHSMHQFHRAILDRLRLPARALQGLKMAEDGTAIDHANDVASLFVWLDSYMAYAVADAVAA